MKIDWCSEENLFFFNPYTPENEKTVLRAASQKFGITSHILVATSGSTSAADSSAQTKWVALHKKAFLASAEAVNHHLDVHSQQDVILNALPTFHVGGLGAFARSFASGARIIDTYSPTSKWNPHEFKRNTELHKVTITSLVPTQLFDLIKEKIYSPPHLRVVIVGGGPLPASQYQSARKLGWPVVPSYGMTECASQIATARPEDCFSQDIFPKLHLLRHLDAKIDPSGKICVQGSSLLTGYLVLHSGSETPEMIDPTEKGDLFENNIPFLRTQDLGQIQERKLDVFGRSDELVKVGGELVSLPKLENLLTMLKARKEFEGEIVLFPKSDERLGFAVAVAFAPRTQTDEAALACLLDEFNELVFPFERVRFLCFVKEIPRTDLGKIKKKLIPSLIFYEKRILKTNNQS